MKEVVIIKAGGSNFASVEDALERIGCKVFYAQNERDIQNAEKVLLPGVGSMKNASLDEIRNVVQNLKQPVLGICLGMQMLFCSSQEATEVKTIGAIGGDVVRFGGDVIAPHTGWNKLVFTEEKSIFAEIPASHVYFTHSYYVPLGKYTISYCQYGNYKVSGIVQKNNFHGFQFHPERSGLYGEALLKQFINKA